MAKCLPNGGSGLMGALELIKTAAELGFRLGTGELVRDLRGLLDLDDDDDDDEEDDE